jgi:hypothetical protein
MRWWKSGKREQRSFRKRAHAIELAHAQTQESVALLARKYESRSSDGSYLELIERLANASID